MSSILRWMKNRLLFFYDYLLIISSLFIGDKTFYGISIFIPIWIAVFLRRKSITRIEIYSQLILVVSAPILFRGAFISDNVEYYNYYMQAIGFVNVIGFMFEFFDKYSKKEIIYFSFLFLLGFSIGTALFNILNGGRGRFVFGPNVTYRVISVFFGFILACNYDKLQRTLALNKVLILSCFIFFFGMFFTGSRGALVVVIAYFILIMYLTYKQPKIFLFFLVVCSLFIFFIVYNWDLFEVFFNRILYFNLDNNSEGFRLSKWEQVHTFYNSDGFYFGLTEENNIISYYPHNIFLEVLFYFGFFAALVFIISFVFYCLSFNIMILVNMIMIGIVIGSMVSGNLQYNYMVLSSLSYSTVLFLNRLGRKIER